MKLSPRQEQILGFLADGLTVPEVAIQLKQTEGAVRNQIARSLKKKGLKRTRDLVFREIRRRMQKVDIKDTQAVT